MPPLCGNVRIRKQLEIVEGIDKIVHGTNLIDCLIEILAMTI